MYDCVGPGNTVSFTVSAHNDDNGGDREAALYWNFSGYSAEKDEGGWVDLALSIAPTVVEAGSRGQVKAEMQNSTEDSAPFTL